MTLIPESTFKEYECTLEKCSKCDLESERKELCQICNELEGYFPLKNHLIEGDLLLNKDNYTQIISEMSTNVNYFKVDINNDKRKALICGFSSNTFNFCFNHNTSQTSIDFKYIFPQDVYCPVNYNLFKIKYFQQKDEFLFSCINYDNNLNYVIFNLDNNANIYNINLKCHQW